MSQSKHDNDWTRLTEPKQWSRLLYPNPVCFLCTPGIQPDDADVDYSYNAKTTAKGKQLIDESENSKIGSSTHDMQTCPTHLTVDMYMDNVMTISWLTAINNEGGFIMSINRRRYTANYFEDTIDAGYNNKNKVKGTTDKYKKLFVLAVPVAGAEDLIRTVGSITGRNGVQKFRKKHTSLSDTYHSDNTELMSKRQKKKHGYPDGIPGLIKVPVGSMWIEDYCQTSPIEKEYSNLFAIHGTIAHLVCQVKCLLQTINDRTTSTVIENDDEISDSSHLLVQAQLVDAFVLTSYWDSKKNIIRRSSPDLPQLLSFLGSHEFATIS